MEHHIKHTYNNVFINTNYPPPSAIIYIWTHILC